MTIPSEVARGVVARSVAALSKGPNRLLGYIENMSGYYCRDCDAVKPLFVASEPAVLGIPCLGTVPFESGARAPLRSGDPLRPNARDCGRQRPGRNCRAAVERSRADHGECAMKFLCVPCDSPMKLQSVGPPDDGSLSVVYSCPECGYEMAMLTNAYETQIVRSMGVRIGPELKKTVDGQAGAESAPASLAEASAEAASGCPFAGMIQGTDAGERRLVAEPIPVRWTAAAEARLANVPHFVRPMARAGIEKFATENGAMEVDEQILDAAREFFGM